MWFENMVFGSHGHFVGWFVEVVIFLGLLAWVSAI